jgi:hypothetical protein
MDMTKQIWVIAPAGFDLILSSSTDRPVMHASMTGLLFSTMWLCAAALS